MYIVHANYVPANEKFLIGGKLTYEEVKIMIKNIIKKEKERTQERNYSTSFRNNSESDS